MPFKSIIRDLKGKNGLNNKQKKLSEAKCVQGHTKSHITPPSKSALVQENLLAILPSELPLDIFGRVEENETTGPARMAVVTCAGVCRSWREVAKEVVKTPEECRLLTFPMSLKLRFSNSMLYQKGKDDINVPIVSWLEPCTCRGAEQIVAGCKRIRRATKTDFLISLSTKDFTQTSNNYVGKLRSNFFGSKFVIHDCQPPSSSVIQSHGRSHKKVSTKKVSPRLPVCNYNVATISYELNVLRTRGPRRMQSNMQTIPVSAIQEGGSAPTPATFSSDLEEMFSPLTVLTEKNQNLLPLVLSSYRHPFAALEIHLF